MADHDAAKAVVARRAAAKGASAAVPSAVPTMSPSAAHGLATAAPEAAPELAPVPVDEAAAATVGSAGPDSAGPVMMPKVPLLDT